MVNLSLKGPFPAPSSPADERVLDMLVWQSEVMYGPETYAYTEYGRSDMNPPIAADN